MSTIDLTNDLALRLIDRCKKEYGETSIANFALDLILTDLANENEFLKQEQEALLKEKEVLLEKIRQQSNLIAELQEQAFPERKFNKKVREH